MNFMVIMMYDWYVSYCNKKLIDKLTMKSLFNLSITKVVKNLHKYKNTDTLENLPMHIKSNIIKLITDKYPGFRDNIIIKKLLHHNIKGLSLTSSTINDQTLEILASSCPSLKQLIINASTQKHCITNEGLIRNITQLSELESLVIRNSEEVNDSFIHEITEKCPKLRSLDFFGCSKITMDSLESFKKLNLKKLELLDTEVGDDHNI